MKAVLLLVVTVWIWSTVTIVPAWAVITFDFTEGESSYSASIQSLRDELKSKTEKYGVPVMERPSKEPNFLLVDLKASTNKIITLAVNVADLYVVAYRDTYEGRDRAHFFPNTPEKVKSQLFKGVKSEDIKSDENYGALEKAAKQSRQEIELGIEKLRFAMHSVFGKPIDKKHEAKFLIISIQMISEAARFKYIENKIGHLGFEPDYKVLNLENNWQAISKAFQKSKDGKFSPPLQLIDPDNEPWEVKEVGDISPDMGILKYEA